MLYLFASEAPNGRHLAGDINEVIWGSIAFFVVLFLLIRFAGGPALKALRGRTERIETELAEAKAARAEAEAALTASSSDLPDLGEEEARIRAEANETASRLKSDLIAKAQADADEVRARGTVEVENYRRQAVTDLSSEVARLTKESAEAVVVNTLDDRAHADLLENYINQVEQRS